MSKKAIYPGTFDPVTNGHLDIILRASTMFEQVVIAVASNAKKKPYIAWADRIQLTKKCVAHISNVEVIGFDNLLIHFAQEQQAKIILRGLRAMSDFEYEFQLAGMNRKLCSNIETLFLTPSENVMFVSSSLVREIAAFGGDISGFVPHEVVDYLDNINV